MVFPELKLKIEPPVSIRDRIYDYIKQEILSDKIPEDAILVETRLAEQMGVSRTPVREAYASLAKNAAAEAAIFCTTEGLHLHGGYGFTTEYEISKLARDAHIIDIYEGVREVQNMIIGREIV